MSLTYHIRIKENYAIALIEGLLRMDAIDLIKETDEGIVPNSQELTLKSPQLSNTTKKCIRLFVYYFFNNTLGYVLDDPTILKNISYLEDSDTLAADTMETIFAIYINNIRIDKDENVINHPYAMKRAAQFIRQQCEETGSYEIQPPLEEWETALH